jgi:hypothetical protein
MGFFLGLLRALLALLGMVRKSPEEKAARAAAKAAEETSRANAEHEVRGIERDLNQIENDANRPSRESQEVKPGEDLFRR